MFGREDEPYAKSLPDLWCSTFIENVSCIRWVGLSLRRKKEKGSRPDLFGPDDSYFVSQELNFCLIRQKNIWSARYNFHARNNEKRQLVSFLIFPGINAVVRFWSASIGASSSLRQSNNSCY